MKREQISSTFSPTTAQKAELKEIKFELSSIYRQRERVSKLKTAQDRLDNGENYSPNFYSLFRPSREKISIIPSLLINGEHIQDPKIIKDHVKDHFQSLLRPSPSQAFPPILNPN